MGALAAQLNDVKALCDNEARERGLLLGKYRNLEHELDGARCALEEEAAGRENCLRLVAKAEAESQCWRQKYETDAVAKGEETMLQLEEVRRENKTLSNEIKDIMDQISEGGRSIHEIDKIRKRLEAEKLELQSALEEAEATLEQEENKVLRCQLELNAVRQEIERRLAEKEEEFILVKKAQSKALDSMQVALETETKSKAEALRMKKKLEGDAADLGLALEHAIAGNAETQTTIKKYALQVRDAQKVAGALGDAEASADANEQAMAMRKARAKSASLGL